MGQVVVQRLEKALKSKLEKAEAYYTVLSALNSLKLNRRQIQLLAFTSVRGTITPMSARKEFVNTYKTSSSTMENVKGQLVKKGMLVNKNGMYKVLPTIDLDFSKPIIMNIFLKGGEDEVE